MTLLSKVTGHDVYPNDGLLGYGGPAEQGYQIRIGRLSKVTRYGMYPKNGLLDTT